MPFVFTEKCHEAVYDYLRDNGQSTERQLIEGLASLWSESEVSAAIQADLNSIPPTIELHGTAYAAIPID